MKNASADDCGALIFLEAKCDISPTIFLARPSASKPIVKT
jgi:hypothetical protein